MEKPKDKTKLDSPDQVLRKDDTLSIVFWYPRNEDNVTHIEVGLVDVRASDSIRIHFDFARDGYVIEQASVFEWEADDTVCDPDWKEVSFIPAWGQDKKAIKR